MSPIQLAGSREVCCDFNGVFMAVLSVWVLPVRFKSRAKPDANLYLSI